MEWDGVPLPSFRSHAVLTPINKWYKFACTPEAIKVAPISLEYISFDHVNRIVFYSIRVSNFTFNIYRTTDIIFATKKDASGVCQDGKMRRKCVKFLIVL